MTISPKAADAMFWIAVVACLAAQAAILRSVLAIRGPRAATASGPEPRRAIEVAWAVTPAVALALVLFATWRTLHPRAAERPTATVGVTL